MKKDINTVVHRCLHLSTKLKVKTRFTSVIVPVIYLCGKISYTELVIVLGYWTHTKHLRHAHQVSLPIHGSEITSNCRNTVKSPD